MSVDCARVCDLPRILVVDDYPDAAECLARWLRRLGHAVETAMDGDQALRRAKRFLPQLGFLDIAMPHMDGYELAAKIRRQPWGEHVVLIALTAFGTERDRQRSRTAGFDGHITKPAFPEQIKSALDLYFKKPPAWGQHHNSA